MLRKYSVSRSIHSIVLQKKNFCGSRRDVALQRLYGEKHYLKNYTSLYVFDGTMYSAERRQEIMKLIAKDDRVNVADLATYFGISRSSIRRDLNQLHHSGLLSRSYGGALRAAISASATGSANGYSHLYENTYEAPFNERQISHPDEKERIGRAAAQLVQPDETIFLDGGTTVECMTPYLAGIRHLTVVTYGLNIVNRLLVFAQINVIVIGGTLHRRSQTFGGTLALDNLQNHNIRFDKAFVAAGGISVEAGVTNATLEEIPIKRRAIRTAGEAILLADSSKIGVARTGLMVQVEEIHHLITGAQATEAEIQALRMLGVKVNLV